MILKKVIEGGKKGGKAQGRAVEAFLVVGGEGIPKSGWKGQENCRAMGWLLLNEGMMDRLRCGVIVTKEFSAFLREWCLAEPAQPSERVPSLEFVHCREGARAGESWATLSWASAAKIPEHECFPVGEVTLHLSKQSQRGLKWRCLDAREGKLVVIGGE